MSEALKHSPVNGKILIVDDEPSIRKFLNISLSTSGYEIIESDSTEAALKALTKEQPDLLILDLGLPDKDGQTFIQEIREWTQIPILVLSVRADEKDKVQALDNGANDYVTKPFGVGELLARVRALLRIYAVESGKVQEASFSSRGLTVDYVTREVHLNGEKVKLTPKEYELLSILTRNAGKVLTHQYLLKELWGPRQTEHSQYLRVHIGNLRQKLKDDPASPQYIMTEPCVGYRFIT